MTCDLDSFNEDDLYANLDWLHENQSKIEDRLFRATHQDARTLFLYDVTSSYLEGRTMTSGHSVTTEMAVSNKLCWVCSAMIKECHLGLSHIEDWTP